MRTFWKPLEATNTSHDDLLGAALVLLEEGTPKFQPISVFTTGELDTPVVRLVAQGTVAQERPQKLRKFDKVKLLSINTGDHGEPHLGKWLSLFSMTSSTRPQPRLEDIK